MLCKLAILLTAALCGYADENAVAFADGIPQYCQESCPEGWSFIDGLQHCYRLGSEDPTSNVANFMDADTQCRSLGGSLPEADNMEEAELLHDWVREKMLAAVDSPKAFEKQSRKNETGLWWGYARRCYEAEVGERGYVERRKKENYFSVNSPSARMPCNLWRQWPREYSQPRDEAGVNQGFEEACVARKKLFGITGWINGLDDYPCFYENFIVCMKTNIPNLQQRCHNPANNLMGERPAWKKATNKPITMENIAANVGNDFPRRGELVIESLETPKPSESWAKLTNFKVKVDDSWDSNRQCKA